jgi:hypothetical protein
MRDEEILALDEFEIEADGANGLAQRLFPYLTTYEGRQAMQHVAGDNRDPSHARNAPEITATVA